jgi:hypothetical protein
MPKDGRHFRGVLAATALGLAALFWPGDARAQFGIFGGGAAPGGSAGGPTQTPAAGSMYANPLMNPYMNPLVNPYANQQATAASPANAALYLFAAQSMYGGIGSGRISGTRPGPAASQARKAPEADPPATRGTSNMPGGTAARFFSRAYTTPRAPGRFYNRPSRYFPQTGN